MARVTTARVSKKLRAVANPVVGSDGYMKMPLWRIGRGKVK